MKPISLSQIWQIENPLDFKAHFARRNAIEEPLEAWVRNKMDWQGWQEYRPKRNEFNRPLIFSLIYFYHETDTWLFGGVFRILERLPDQYIVELTDMGSEFIGRLKLRSPYRQRATRVNFENHFESFEVGEVLREPYSGRSFPGFDEIDISFDELETLVRNERPDWRAALENVKGVYLISDMRTGKRYVGSAYGEQGIWSRWCQYATSGHGGNVELRKLVNSPDLDYCKANFRFALLDHRPLGTPDETVLNRETYWKQVLFTRGSQGMNRN